MSTERGGVPAPTRQVGAARPADRHRRMAGVNSGLVMHVNITCVHCGQLLKVPAQAAGRRVKCGHCGREFTMAGAADSGAIPALTSPEERSIMPGRRVAMPDATLSRSMIGPTPGMSPAPLDEMLCRLEPGSLRWLGITDAARDFLGATLEQLKGQTFFQALHPDDRALADDEFRQTAERGERHDFILRIRVQAGQWHYVRVYAQARYNPDGKVNHIRCVLKDVTDRVRADEELRRRTEQLTTANEQLRQTNQKLKEAQSQLVHSEKLAALGTLASGMAHEINNPLAFASNNVAVLERDIGALLDVVAAYQGGLDDLRRARPDLAERVEGLQEEVDLPYIQENLVRLAQATRKGLGRVARIVEDLRGFAQLDRAEIGVIDVNEAVDQSLGMLSASLSQHRIEVLRRYEDVPPLECAGAHLNQVFFNLLTNAVQAIEATGRGSGLIRVATRATADAVIVEVADDGTGIPAEVVPKVFDPFFTTKPIGQGTGLGLSISHGIISEQGGRIEIESAVGAGTTFRIHLPLLRAAARGV